MENNEGPPPQGPPPVLPIFGCPPGLEPLSSIGQVITCCRPVDYREYTADVITDTGVRIYQAAEGGGLVEQRSFSTSGLGMCMAIFRYDGMPTLEAFSASQGCCTVGQMLVAYNGSVAGYIKQSSGKCNGCGTLTFSVTDGTGQPILHLLADNSPCGIASLPSAANYTVMLPDKVTQVGSINYQFNSNYVVSFKPDMKVTTKGILMGAAIMLQCQIISMQETANSRIRQRMHHY